MSESGILKEIEIFSKLDDDSLSKLQELSQVREFGTGEIIFKEEESGDNLYVILDGRVKITKTISLGVDKVLIIISKGSLFGELALISPQPRSATAHCDEDCKVLEIGRDNFQKFVQAFPLAGVAILSGFAEILADRLRITTDSYKESILWGMKVSGASQLNFDTLIQDNTEIGVTLYSGTTLKGRILKVDTSIGGCEITLTDQEDKLYVILYSAIAYFTLPHSALRTQDVL